MTTYIVTGLGYGDEGKGSVVDYLSRQGSTVVVRHNGGPQAGHNVVTDDGRHHTFSQFGSGTFAGAKTFLSRFMLINPLNMMKEADHLIDLGEDTVMARTFVDENAVLITPWHVILNRLAEEFRGDGRHGSCGEGVGEAMEQQIQYGELTLRVKDFNPRVPLAGSGLVDRMERLRQYLMQCGARRGVAAGPTFELLCDPHLVRFLAKKYREWHQSVRVVPSDYLDVMIDGHDHIVFEGAQGVLLDEWRGFHPYTTWSTTTHDNALELLWDTGRLGHKAIKYGVTRAYMTRHGPGPFVTEDSDLCFSEPHNVMHPWQGGFRQGHLDLVALRYAIKVCGGVDRLAVTHLDRADNWRVCRRYESMDEITPSEEKDLDHQARLTARLQKEVPVYGDTVCAEELVETLEEDGGPVGLLSYGPTASGKKVTDDSLVSSLVCGG